MATNVTNTGTTAKKFIKPDYIVATLFTGAESDETAPAGESIIIEDVIEDTTSISQDDNDTTTIECETSDSPIIEIVKLGKWNIAAEVGDVQHVLLEKLAGFTYDSSTQRSYAPSSYAPKYIKFDIVYKDGENLVAFVAPKVQLNTRLLIESLNSNLGRISLAGSAKDIAVTVGSNSIRTPFYTDENYTLPTKS